MKILAVDDDPHNIALIEEILDEGYDVRTASGGGEGLETLSREGPFAVVLSDLHMPGMDGIAFLSEVRDRAPDTVGIMVTGDADLQCAIDAVNQGRIFRFLTKPYTADVITTAIDAALEEYRVRQAERSLLEQTVRGSIEVLVDVLSLSSPDAFGRATRVQSYVKQLVALLDVKDTWLYETAALLCQIGFVGIPPEIIEKHAVGEELSSTYQTMMDRHVAIARDLLGKIPRLEPIAAIISNQHLRYEDVADSGLDRRIALGAQMLAVALDLDESISLGESRSAAIETLRQREGHYDPAILRVLGGIKLPGQDAVLRTLRVKDLRIGMVLDQEVRTKSGAVIVGTGNKITQSILARLRNYAELGNICEPIRAHAMVRNYADLAIICEPIQGSASKPVSSRPAPRSAPQADEGIAGSLDDVSLSALLTLLEFERKSGVLLIVSAGGTESAKIFVSDGRVIRATTDDDAGPKNEECVYYLLRRTGGRFIFSCCPVAADDDEIRTPTTQLLMEGARRMDEGSLDAARATTT